MFASIHWFLPHPISPSFRLSSFTTFDSDNKNKFILKCQKSSFAGNEDGNGKSKNKTKNRLKLTFLISLLKTVLSFLETAVIYCTKHREDGNNVSRGMRLDNFENFWVPVGDFPGAIKYQNNLRNTIVHVFLYKRGKKRGTRLSSLCSFFFFETDY